MLLLSQISLFQYLVRTWAEYRFKAFLETVGQFFWGLPVNTVKLPDIKMEFIHVVFSASPDYRQIQAHGKTSFKVDTSSLASKICNNKTRVVYQIRSSPTFPTRIQTG